MLNFMRSKTVGVEQKDGQTLVARGALMDDIYGMRLEVTVRLPDLTITAIQGHLDRYTTPECPQADVFLQEAVGLKVDDPEFPRQVHRSIWRRSCQHYASLLVECGESLRGTAQILKQEAEKARDEEQAGKSETAPKARTASFGRPPRPVKVEKRARGRGEGFVIDLHVHTSQASPCSSAPVDELIRQAKRSGLDAVCLTDHNHVWNPDAVEELRRKHDFLVLRGNEVTTDQGDMLVYGLDKEIKGITPLAQLRQDVLAAGAFMAAAHPFRGFLLLGVGGLGLTVERAVERELFAMVDGLEIRNGKVTAEENAFAQQVAATLGLPALGGSDAHQVGEVGRYATCFEEPVRNEEELVAALRSGRYSVLDFGAD